MLKSSLYEKQQDEKRAEMEKFYGEKGEMGWGNQTAVMFFSLTKWSKILAPVSTSAVQSVMDGELDSCERMAEGQFTEQRNKDIQVDD